jgi:hypothetical protein
VTYQTYAATNYVGQGDISNKDGDVESCKTACDAMTGDAASTCSGFVSRDKHCWFKNNTVKTPSYDTTTTYYYKGSAPPGPATAPVAGVYNTYAGVDYANQGDISNTDGNGTTCQPLCDATPNCAGFAATDTHCWFKSADVKTPNLNPALTYYYKGTPPPPLTNACANAPSATGKCPQTMTAPVGKCTVNMQDDGNLVVYNAAGKAVWASNTNGKGTGPYRAVMQTDGNYVVYDSTNKALWASGTYGKGTPPYFVIMQDDCNLVVYDKNSKATWATGTYGK